MEIFNATYKDGEYSLGSQIPVMTWKRTDRVLFKTGGDAVQLHYVFTTSDTLKRGSIVAIGNSAYRVEIASGGLAGINKYSITETGLIS